MAWGEIADMREPNRKFGSPANGKYGYLVGDERFPA
jgi:hypothetical protein